MPAFPSLHPRHVSVKRLRTQHVSRSPWTLTPEVLDWGGRAWMVEVDTQDMDRDDLETWADFLGALDVAANSFALDISPYCPGVSLSGTPINFRVIEPEVGLSNEFTLHGRARLVAIEDVLADADEVEVLPIFGEGWEVFSTPTYGEGQEQDFGAWQTFFDDTP